MIEEKLDLLALMPCPIKVPLEKEISKIIKKINGDYDTSLSCRIVSNAIAQEAIFEEIAASKNFDELPEIMIAPGFSRFFYRDFVDDYRRRGYFAIVNNLAASNIFRKLDITDPDGCYDILAFNPLVFLVNKTTNSEFKAPTRWSDLTKVEYRNKVAYRGHNDRQFCEGVLLNIYKELGREGIRKLGGSVKCRLHPAQMVKYAGSKSEDAPFVSVIPYSFACMVRQNSNVEIVWPEDGAIVNPLVMLVKKNCIPAIKDLAMELSNNTIGSIFLNGGFYPLHEDEESLNGNKTFKWLGWDFIKGHDLYVLLEELNQIMFDSVHNQAGFNDNNTEEGGCSCS